MSEVWMRERPSPRRSAPSVDQIVARAVAIADAEGGAAVTMRRVAAELQSGTASLYRYVTNRDELVDLMIDAVQGESPPPTRTGDWRVDLTAIAHRLRDLWLRHPWLSSELTGRPPLGPESLRHADAALEVALTLTSDVTRASNAIATVRSYVFGSVAAELAELQARRRTGLTEEQWQASVAPYVNQLIESGAYPSLARRIQDGDETPPARQFELGLTWVLDGIGLHHA
ncbi:TetR/AcrR family transcriptional regulator [Tenggerimyces flavus]|uniref:TetR/AcrR family transcriptional regulator n=1 Tax=Tenggerimyces flavus TaxID=1708749 RepID=A0ABV7YAJ9_9ACTN|nr:TetR/AcrR family transcriptional regulator C-terminal domain-containing protein [Tenggerimyces flavus]MBM7783673.1 AcrR family transcriptional regulator [Tenggerimyces flavus]